jgi:hypothetical protein
MFGQRLFRSVPPAPSERPDPTVRYGDIQPNESQCGPDSIITDLSGQSEQVLTILAALQKTLLPRTIIHAFGQTEIVSHNCI